MRGNDTQRLIDEHGWAVIGVFPTTTDEGPPFCYTVGLTERNLPELAIYGLDLKAGGGVLNAAARRLIDAGEPRPGEVLHGLLVGDLPLVTIDMTDTADLNAVRAHYGAVWAARQVIWPDSDGRMPWEGWDLGAVQPMKGQPPA